MHGRHIKLLAWIATCSKLNQSLTLKVVMSLAGTRLVMFTITVTCEAFGHYSSKLKLETWNN